MTEILHGLHAHYDCDLSALPKELRARFVQLDYDASTRAFVEGVREARTSRARTALFMLLRRFLSDYDAYGMLGMYSMHVLSLEQWTVLLGPWLATFGAVATHTPGSALSLTSRARLLDIGAGDGGVTARAAPLFAEVTATEASRPLRKRLRKRGFRVIEHDLGKAPWPHDERFDVVSAWNVLDRTARPRTLLANMRALLAENGRMLLSLPLPLRPHVHVGPTTIDQDETLPTADDSFESGVATLCTELFAPAGLRVLAFSRVPYLCQGDAKAPLYILDDAVFVCERA